jgi:hypothetical protein
MEICNTCVFGSGSRVVAAWSRASARLSSLVFPDKFCAAYGPCLTKRNFGIVPSFLRFVSVMRSLVEDNKIVHRVVGFVSVYVMNAFVCPKRSSERFFNDVAMFINISSVNPDTNISVFHNGSPTLPVSVIRPARAFPNGASNGAEFLSSFPVRIWPKFFSASQTMFNHTSDYINSTVECQ